MNWPVTAHRDLIISSYPRLHIISRIDSSKLLHKLWLRLINSRYLSVVVSHEKTSYLPSTHERVVHIDTACQFFYQGLSSSQRPVMVVGRTRLSITTSLSFYNPEQTVAGRRNGDTGLELSLVTLTLSVPFKHGPQKHRAWQHLYENPMIFLASYWRSQQG